MSRTSENGHQTGDERLTTLLHNVNAVRAVSSAVEGTLGPKGLDTMLVDDQGNVMITNDGVTILEKMEVKHPAARMLIKIATAQQAKVGDGTTTATILASALVQEGAAQVQRGVPAVQVITGMKKGVAFALERLDQLSASISHLDDPNLKRVAFIAARENEDICDLVMQGAKAVGMASLLDEQQPFSALVYPCEGEKSEVLSGVLLDRLPLSKQMPKLIDQPLILIMEDALAPEEIDDEALGTEIGFQRFLDYKETFKYNLQRIASLGINLIVCQRTCDSYAEEFCTDHGITVLHRASRQEIRRLAEHTGAKPIKRTGLHKSQEDLSAMLGKAERFRADERTGQARIENGSGTPTATILVGAATAEVVGERGRIASDAAASVQAAIKGGIVSGGGSAEMAIARELEAWRTGIQGLEGYGVEAVIAALQKPLSQMIINAGYSTLEKLEAIRSEQHRTASTTIGLDFTDGKVKDLGQIGIYDPTLVKKYALQAAAEVAESILRIHTVIRMKTHADDQE